MKTQFDFILDINKFVTANKMKIMLAVRNTTKNHKI